MEQTAYIVLITTTLGALFLYIHHQIVIVDATYEKQRIEQAIAALKNDIQLREQELYKLQGHDEIMARATKMGMRPTVPSQLIAASPQKDD